MIALARLRESARLRRSLALCALTGLVAGEAIAVLMATLHGAGTLPETVSVTAVWWVGITAVVVGGAALLTTPDGHPVDRYGVPNGLTALRAYACLPMLFIAALPLSGHLPLALWAGIGGSIGLLDAVDGFIARRFGPITVLGKAMDPLGDALFFLVGALGCYLLGIAPLWLTLLIVVRYGGPVLLAPLVFLAGKRPELVYTRWGRLNTQLTGGVLFVLFWVRLADGPVAVSALIVGIPTLVPTTLLHFVALVRRVVSSPRTR